MHTFTKTCWFAVCGFCFLLAAATAKAAPADARATKLADQAMREDFAQRDFGFAVDKLKQALGLCETKCSAKVKARIFRDLGVVYLDGKQDRESAVAAFMEALTADPDVKLDPRVGSPDVRAAFKEVRSMVNMDDDSEADSEPEPEPKAPPKPKAAKKPAAGAANADLDADEDDSEEEADEEEEEEEEEVVLPPSITFEPVQEQRLGHPLPLFIQLREVKALRIGEVDVLMRAFGEKEFTKLALSKHRDGWAIEIPCDRIGTTAGKFSFYFTAFDKAKKEIVSSGTATEPHVTNIREQFKGDAPHLPGKAAPAACKQSDDCPPDFPGCAGGGALLLETAEPEVKDTTPRIWLSVALQGDLLWLPAAQEACSQGSGYDCFYSGDTYRDPSLQAGAVENDGDVKGAGTVSGGFTPATLRLLIGADYVFSPNIRGGIRLGYALGGGPQAKTDSHQGSSFLPFHAEVKGTYLFDHNIPSTPLKPFITLAAGLAQVDGSVHVPIIDLAFKDACKKDIKDASCLQQDLAAWRKTGKAFIALGGGTEFALDATQALTGELRLMQLFPETGTVISLQLGYKRAW